MQLQLDAAAIAAAGTVMIDRRDVT